MLGLGCWVLGVGCVSGVGVCQCGAGKTKDERKIMRERRNKPMHPSLCIML